MEPFPSEKRAFNIHCICMFKYEFFNCTFIFLNINAANIGMARFFFHEHAGKATYKTRVRNPAVHIQWNKNTE